MLNRRLIRIKVFKVLYSSVASGSDSLTEAGKTLNYSCEKTLHLYYFILNAAVALAGAAQAKIDTGLKKFNPTLKSAIRTASLRQIGFRHILHQTRVSSNTVKIMD